MPTTAEYSLFGDNAYGGPAGGTLKHELPGSWKIMHLPIDPVHLDNPITGFRAHVYHNKATKEVVIAFSGTNLADKGDLSTISEIIAGHEPKQFDNAFAIYNAVKLHLARKNEKAKLCLTGHSLGGALAQYMAIAVQGLPAETFGAPGILQALDKLRTDYIPDYPYPVVNHVALGDPIGMFGTHLGETKFYALDAMDFIMPVAMPYLIRKLVIAGLMTYRGHTMNRYFHSFRQPGGTLQPTGKVTYKNGKRYEIFKRFNWSGVATDDYI
jgi:hypothetical protein